MERYYFIVINNQQLGPFTLDQLKGQPITTETKIWYQGLDGWKTLAELPELSQQLSHLLPPPVGNSAWNNTTGDIDAGPPKTYLTEAILVTLFCCWPFGIPAIVNASKVEGRFASGDHEGARQASAEAKKWMNYSLWSGLAIGFLYFLLLLATGGKFA